MAEKFKVGDRVTVTDWGNAAGLKKGEVYVVTRDQYEGYRGPYVDIEGKGAGWDVRRFQLVEEFEEVRPADLKAGDEVRVTVRTEVGNIGGVSKWLYMETGTTVCPKDIVKVERVKREEPKTTVTLELSKEQLNQLTSLAGHTFVGHALADVYDVLCDVGGKSAYEPETVGGVIRLKKR